jgi:lipoic acid synthetase
MISSCVTLKSDFIMNLTDIPIVTRTPALANEKARQKLHSLHLSHDLEAPRVSKPKWIRAQLPKNDDIPKIAQLKHIMKQQGLHSVCEEASCPNLPECFGSGTATFMIMGHICTRKCPFCDVTHGRPQPLDTDEPQKLANTVKQLGLRYIVITSVDRDDLPDGGASHFVAVIQALRQTCPEVRIEILTPDFRGCLDLALDQLEQSPPDVFNHNLETVSDLYRYARPGADYGHSLKVLQQVKQRMPHIPTKSGIMLGLGEEKAQVLTLLADMRSHDIEWLTLGQYLQPSIHHLPVSRFVPPDEFEEFAQIARQMGFTQVASGPMVRSSYHAELLARPTQSSKT